MSNMTEDEELREFTDALPDAAREAQATAAFEAFELEWWREREERRLAAVGRARHPASSPPLGHAGKGRA